MPNADYPKATLSANTQNLIDELISKMTPPVFNDVNIQRLREVIEDIVKYDIQGMDQFLRRLLRALGVKEE